MFIQANAKLNLTLDVLSKRPDGYHDMRMIMQSITLADDLTVEPLDWDEMRVKTNVHFLPNNEKNLAAQAGQAVVNETGYDYQVTAELTNCWFPTKEYEGFALPAGNYNALRIVIGEGKGQNWWCVAFPPLCLGAASETVEEATQAGYFTPGQAALVTEQDEGYVLKFKSLELLGQLQGLLS